MGPACRWRGHLAEGRCDGPVGPVTGDVRGNETGLALGVGLKQMVVVG